MLLACRKSELIADSGASRDQLARGGDGGGAWRLTCLGKLQRSCDVWLYGTFGDVENRDGDLGMRDV